MYYECLFYFILSKSQSYATNVTSALKFFFEWERDGARAGQLGVTQILLCGHTPASMECVEKRSFPDMSLETSSW